MSELHILDVLAARRGCYISDLNLAPFLRRMALSDLRPVSYTHLRQPKQPKKEDISRALDDRKPWQASFQQTCGVVWKGG